MEKDIRFRIDEFLDRLKETNWFSNSGELSEEYTVVLSFVEAWDVWNKKMMAVWPVETHSLETTAIKIIGDDMIDFVFDTISKEIGFELEKGFCAFQNKLEKNRLDSEEYGLGFEIIDFIKRDVAWACIEYILDINGFFSTVLKVLFEGRWPCAWDGDYPSGRFVVM